MATGSRVFPETFLLLWQVRILGGYPVAQTKIGLRGKDSENHEEPRRKVLGSNSMDDPERDNESRPSACQLLTDITFTVSPVLDDP